MLIVVLTGLLEMLLPENQMKSFVKVVMGLFIIVTLLGPVAEAVKWDGDWALGGFWAPGEGEQQTATVLSAGQKMGEKWGERVWEDYQQRLARQVEAMVNLVPGVARSEAKVTLREKGDLYSLGAIESIWVGVFLTGEEVVTPQLPEGGASSGSRVENRIAVPLITVSTLGRSEMADGSNDLAGDRAAVSSFISSDKDFKGSGSKDSADKEIIGKVKDLLANFYNLPPEKVEVEIKK